MKFKKGDVVVLNSKGKEMLGLSPNMYSKIAFTYINKYSAEVLEVRDDFVKLKYLVNDGAKGYWLDKSVFFVPRLLDLKDK